MVERWKENERLLGSVGLKLFSFLMKWCFFSGERDRSPFKCFWRGASGEEKAEGTGAKSIAQGP